MPRRSLFNQFSQVRGTRDFDDDFSYIDLAETAGRSYLTGTLAVTSGTATATDSSNNFDKDEQNNFVVIASGPAAGVYTVISGSGGSTVGLSPTPTGTDATASYTRHYYQNLEDDLNYIRSMLNRVIGQSNWYDDPAVTLSGLDGHTHTESDITDLGNYSTVGHGHTESDISDLDKYTRAEVDALVSGTNEFLELTDTISSYTDGRMLVETDAALVDYSGLTYASGTSTFTAPNVSVTTDLTVGNDADVTGNLAVDGTFGFDAGTTVNEIVTSMGAGSTDDQLPTAKSVYDAIEAKPNDFLGLTDTPATYSGSETEIYFTGASGVISDADLTYDPDTDTFSTTDITNQYIYADNNDGTSYLFRGVVDMLSAVRGEATQGNAAGYSSGLMGVAEGGAEADGVVGISNGGGTTAIGVAGDATGATTHNIGMYGGVGVYPGLVTSPASGTLNVGVRGAATNAGTAGVAYCTGGQFTANGANSGGSTGTVYGVYIQAYNGTDATWGLYVDAGDTYLKNTEIHGTLEFDNNANTVDEITTTVDSSSTDDQLPTAKAVYDEIASVSGSIDDAMIWETVDTPTDQVRVKTAYQSYALYHNGNVTIGGDLSVSGTTTTINSQELTVADKMITVNYGEAGAGITGDQYAGIEVDRGSETNYQFVFDEVQDNFRVGISGSLQAVATREDSPTDGNFAVWNDSATRFDTSISLVDSAGSLSAASTDTEIATAKLLYNEIEAVSTASGTLDHALLTNLDYASSGHTGFAPTVHSHTESDITDLGNYSVVGHSHTESDITDLGNYSVVGHTHDDRYYTETEIDALLDGLSSTFIELTDTPSSYTANYIPYVDTTASGLTWGSGLTFDGTVLTATSFSGTAGAAISEFSTDTTLSGNSDTAVPTEAAVKTYVDNAVTEGVPTFYQVPLVRQSARVWTYGSGFTEVPNALQVYLNGVLQKGSDSDYYTAAINGGALEITFDFDTYTDDWASATYGTYAAASEAPSGGSGLEDWTIVTSNGTTMATGGRYMLDSAGGVFTITLPSSPSAGNEVTLLDAGGQANTNNITVARAGSNIEGAASDLTIDTDSASFMLVYYNSARGWVIAD